MTGPVPGGEFITSRSSSTSTDPAAVERFVSVDPAAERAWWAWINGRAPWTGTLTAREWAKLSYLAGWWARELAGR